jgi:outer membrane protein OmpA-like peptidoglycan-associated protein
LLTGNVLDAKTNTAVSANIVFKDLTSGRIIGTAETIKDIGNYQLILPEKSVYSIYAEAEGYYPKRDTLDLTNLKQYKTEKKDLYLQKIETGTPIRLNNVFFKRSEATLLPTSYDELNKLVEFMNSQSHLNIEVHGHTDRMGDPEMNMKLSWGRANAIKDYLIKNGIAKKRIETRGFGDTKIICDPPCVENRRVEFITMDR